jgi:hypothetical protein
MLQKQFFVRTKNPMGEVMWPRGEEATPKKPPPGHAGNF